MNKMSSHVILEIFCDFSLKRDGPTNRPTKRQTDRFTDKAAYTSLCPTEEEPQNGRRKDHNQHLCLPPLPPPALPYKPNHWPNQLPP